MNGNSNFQGMIISDEAPVVGKWPDLYPVSLIERPTSFSDCLLAIASRLRSFFRKITQNVKPVWITGIVTGISKYQADRWYVDLRGPDDTYIKAVVNPNLPNIEGFQICDTVKVEGTFAFILRQNHLDQFQIQFEVIRSFTTKFKVDYAKRQGTRKPKPDKIERIGIITSPSGKAISDFYAGLGEYLQKAVSVEIEDVQLGKSRSIIERIREADAKRYDVLVITRGGGIDLDLFNLPTLVEALRQCRSFTVSALGHADDDMIFDINADMAVTTPTAAGNELQKHIHFLRKSQRNTGSIPIISGPQGVGQKTTSPPKILNKDQVARSWILILEDFNRDLWRWIAALLKTTWITALALASLTILLYLVQHCAIPVAKTGTEIWNQVHSHKPKIISNTKQVQQKNSRVEAP